jgi:hypothetical protein
VAIDAQDGIQHEGYSPYGRFQPEPVSRRQSSRLELAGRCFRHFFTINESDGLPDIVFGTQSGLFAVDTGNGTILVCSRMCSFPSRGTRSSLPAFRQSG